ncbi:hypothetical protein D7D52_34205 [Nocardia yunnanensis]|uniref:Uncharacterized protein n=1 Tax=Nocardia yunnanensis TaxID=2382165 RepID=A0A386ZL66_9NOCA|nr:hypothetical protein [Nocardia yunnanensis]AYF78040.1 hypothetical protein D7D52_34205 [Nocardia yunnanensis]
MNLFGDLPGFAGGPRVPDKHDDTAVPSREAAQPEYEDYELPGDIRDHSWDDLPSVRPGHRTVLWGDPERTVALQGPLSATDPVLGVEPTTEAGTARVEKHITSHEIEKRSTIECSTTVTIHIKAQP